MDKLKPGENNLHQYGHPVVFFANGLGDHILTMPALRALCRIFPNKITLICVKGVQEEFFDELPLRNLVPVQLDKENASRRPLGLRESIDQFLGCDLFISLNTWPHPDQHRELLDIIKPAYSIGFNPIFDKCLPSMVEIHAADLVFRIPQFLEPSFELDDFSYGLPLRSESLAMASELFALIPKGMSILTLHTTTQAEKMWDFKKWSAVLDRFLEARRDFAVLIVGCDAVPIDCPKWTNRIISCCGLPLNMSMAVVAGSNLFAGVDSCMLHVADISRVPAVGLFGPTSPIEWGCRFTRHAHVFGNGSMDNISEDDVLQAILCMLFEADPFAGSTLTSEVSTNDVAVRK